MAKINLGKVVPEKGVDYFTEEEIATIENEIINEIDEEQLEPIKQSIRDMKDGANIDSFGDVETSIGEVQDVIGNDTETFSSSSTYEIGDKVIHNNKLYKCILSVTTAGVWNSANWQEISILDYEEEQDASIEALEDRVEILENTIDSELSDSTATGTSITVNDSANAPAVLLPSGNTEQATNIITYTCDGTETGDYYFTYNSINYQFTMPTISANSVLAFNTDTLKLYLGDTEISTTTDNTGTLITMADTPNLSYLQTIHNVSGHSEFKISNADDTEYQTAKFTLVEGQKMFLGDYLADDGIHHVRTQIILDGTEDCTLRSINDNGTYTYVFTGSAGLLRKIKNNLQNSICSHFLYGGLVSNGDQTKTKGIGYYFYYTYGGLNKTLYINSDISNLQNFKSWLAQQYQNGTPVTIEYEVAERYTTAYTELQQAQYNALQNVMSYYEQTNVDTITAGDLEAILTLEYKKSNRLRIDALEQAIISLGGNI